MDLPEAAEMTRQASGRSNRRIEERRFEEDITERELREREGTCTHYARQQLPAFFFIGHVATTQLNAANGHEAATGEGTQRAGLHGARRYCILTKKDNVTSAGRVDGVKMAELPHDGYMLEMCPEKERILRLQNDLVHALEKSCEGKHKLIKKYNRSAAGVSFDSAMNDIRCPEVCLKTALYLVNHVLGNNQLDKSRYHFIADRLRAVRQDLIIRSVNNQTTRRILEICVRFHLYSSHKFRESESCDFDPHLNFQQMLECLKNLLLLYDELDTPLQEREEMSVVYLVLNLGSSSAIFWALSLPKTLRNSHLLKVALDMNLAHHNRNFVRVFKLSTQLSECGQMAFFWNWSELIRGALQIMNVAFSNRALSYPVSHFGRLFNITSDAIVRNICSLLELRIVNDGIFFDKSKRIVAKVNRFQVASFPWCDNNVQDFLLGQHRQEETSKSA